MTYLEEKDNYGEPDGSPVLSCSECGKTFKTDSGREKHAAKCKVAKRHDGFMGYYCEPCGLRFRYGLSFQGHLFEQHGVGSDGESCDGRLGSNTGTVEVIRYGNYGSAYKVIYRESVV